MASFYFQGLPEPRKHHPTNQHITPASKSKISFPAPYHPPAKSPRKHGSAEFFGVPNGVESEGDDDGEDEGIGWGGGGGGLLPELLAHGVHHKGRGGAEEGTGEELANSDDIRKAYLGG